MWFGYVIAMVNGLSFELFQVKRSKVMAARVKKVKNSLFTVSPKVLVRSSPNLVCN